MDRTSTPQQQTTTFDPWRGFVEPKLTTLWYDKLTEMARHARGHILKMTTLANSGHPGGSMSSIEIYLSLYNLAKVDPRNPHRGDRDRIIISHGHTSPGAYTALAAAGFFDVDDAIAGFRQAGSPFEGHVERSVPGIEWGTGNLGQGLAAGIGKAIFARIAGLDFHTYVFMGDGEQQKGQIAESRRIAAKFNLTKLTAIIDHNRLQISGKVAEIMPQNYVEEWRADGWEVLEIDGHDLHQIYDALHHAVHKATKPVMILARTTMGKGVDFMENDENFHGAAIKPEQLDNALKQIGNLDNDFEKYKKLRQSGPPQGYKNPPNKFPEVLSGEPITYGTDVKTDNRSAFGKALVSVADANMTRQDFSMAVFDCDLTKSVKTYDFSVKYPANFFQFGISEHSTAAAAGSLSVERALSVWADFGVFGIVETYNQARLSDINHGNVKLFCTHCGVNVGEDGMTHQCIDYFALLNSTFGWKVITPADPNQTDRVVRYALSHPGSFAVIMGRSTLPTVTDENGQPFFGGKYQYRYGRMERIRKGEKVAIAAAGNMLWVAMDAWKQLTADNIKAEIVSISDWSDLHQDDLKHLASFENVFTLEDHNIKTGLGTAIGEAMFRLGLRTKLTKMGVTRYGSSGVPVELYKLLGIDSSSVVKQVKALL